jgi:hypothetical protein
MSSKKNLMHYLLDLPTSLTSRVRRCRRVIVVLSKQLLNDTVAMQVCQAALQMALSPQSCRIIVIQPPRQQLQVHTFVIKVTLHKVEYIAAQSAPRDVTQTIRAQRGKQCTNQCADTRTP